MNGSTHLSKRILSAQDNINGTNFVLMPWHLIGGTNILAIAPSVLGSVDRVGEVGVAMPVFQKIPQLCYFVLLALFGIRYFSIVHPVIVKPFFAQIFENTGAFQNVADGNDAADVGRVAASLRIGCYLPFFAGKELDV
jgi:hypothetical protein